MPISIPKIIIIILIEIIIALVHIFRLGQVFSGELYNLYYSYFSDLILPFGAYFLLSLNDVSIPILRRWYTKAGVVFAMTCLAEICQLFGVEVLGETFDLVDIACYGTGVLAAAAFDEKILSPHLGFWKRELDD